MKKQATLEPQESQFTVDENQNITLTDEQIKQLLDGSLTEELLEYARCFPDYTGIKLDNCKLTAAKITKLSKMLIELDVKQIILSNNPIGDEGVKAFTEVLSKNQRIIQLNLNNCGITDKGVGYIASCDNITQLKNLFLHNNKIENDGARLLAQDSTLQHLSLWGNPLTKALIEPLTEALKTSHITSINVVSPGGINDDENSILNQVCLNNKSKFTQAIQPAKSEVATEDTVTTILQRLELKVAKNAQSSTGIAVQHTASSGEEHKSAGEPITHGLSHSRSSSPVIETKKKKLIKEPSEEEDKPKAKGFMRFFVCCSKS